MATKVYLPLAPSSLESPAIFCFNISSYKKTTQLVLYSATVFSFFLLYGYMQELMFTIEGFKPYGWFLTLVQFGFFSLFGITESWIRKIKSRRIPLKTYFLLALLTLGTMGFSNASLRYLNYPTQVIFKCCKLVPVMAGSIFIQGKRYGPLDFTAAMLLSLGITLFTIADSQIQPSFDVTGVMMISMALLCDALIGNVQEKSIKTYGAQNAEVVLYSYGFGFFFLCVIMSVTGNLIEGLNFFAKNPKECYGYALLFSLTGYLGIQIVLNLVKIFGAFTAVTVTTFRKALTIVISFLLFSKPFTFQYLWSGLIVVLGIYMNLYSKKKQYTFTDLKMNIRNFFKYFNVTSSRRQFNQSLLNV